MVSRLHYKLLALILCGICIPMWGVVLLEDNFPYPAGSTLVNNGWYAHSNAGINSPVTGSIGLTYPGYTPIGGFSAQTVGNGECVSRGFDATTGGSVYCSFLLRINSFPTSAVLDYPIHWGNSFVLSGTPTAADYRGRMFVQKLNDQFRFGISKSSSNQSVIQWSPYSYQPGETYLLVLKYTFISGAGNDLVKLWINPVISDNEPLANLSVGASDAGADPANIACIAIRQSANTPLANYDGFRIATTWPELFASQDMPLSTPAVTILMGQNRTELAWPAISGASSYRVEASEFPDRDYSTIATVTSTSWSENNITSQRFYRVIAE